MPRTITAILNAAGPRYRVEYRMKNLMGTWSPWRPLSETDCARAWQTTHLTEDQARATQERWWDASRNDPHVAHFDHELRAVPMRDPVP